MTLKPLVQLFNTMKKIIFLLIILPFLSYTMGSEEVSVIDNAAASITPRVLGGMNANIGRFVYQVSFRVRGDYFCSAAAIGQFDILGSAGCFTHSPNQHVIWPYLDITVHSGTSSIQDMAHRHRIVKVTVHTGWIGTIESSMNHNIAHVRLEGGGIQFDEYQGAADLPRQDVLSGTQGFMTSWGSTDVNSVAYSNILQMLRLKILTYDDCQPRVVFRVHPEQFCAYIQEGRGCSRDDSGAPLVSNGEIIGIHSWVPSARCADGGPGIFTNVFAERDFIAGAIAQFG